MITPWGGAGRSGLGSISLSGLPCGRWCSTLMVSWDSELRVKGGLLSKNTSDLGIPSVSALKSTAVSLGWFFQSMLWMRQSRTLTLTYSLWVDDLMLWFEVLKMMFEPHHVLLLMLKLVQGSLQSVSPSFALLWECSCTLLVSGCELCVFIHWSASGGVGCSVSCRAGSLLEWRMSEECSVALTQGCGGFDTGDLGALWSACQLSHVAAI